MAAGFALDVHHWGPGFATSGRHSVGPASIAAAAAVGVSKVTPARAERIFLVMLRETPQPTFWIANPTTEVKL